MIGETVRRGFADSNHRAQLIGAPWHLVVRQLPGFLPPGSPSPGFSIAKQRA
jgi:hypothetical protein